ncbi:hypothetical protein BGX26_008939, partial [Mortierella sp. AD094]
MEVRSRGYCDRRSSAQLEEPGQQLHLPSMEPAPTGTREDSSRATDSDIDHSLVAQRDMVSDSSGDDNLPASSDPSGPRASSLGKRKRHPEQEPTLVLDSMASKRHHMELDVGLSSSAIALLNSRGANKKTQAQYRPAQLDFVKWAQQENFDATNPDAIRI